MKCGRHLTVIRVYAICVQPQRHNIAKIRAVADFGDFGIRVAKIVTKPIPLKIAKIFKCNGVNDEPNRSAGKYSRNIK